MREIFKTTCNFNCTKLARKREIAQFGCQNGQKCLKKRESPSERGRVGISAYRISREMEHGDFLYFTINWRGMISSRDKLNLGAAKGS